MSAHTGETLAITRYYRSQWSMLIRSSSCLTQSWSVMKPGVSVLAKLTGNEGKQILLKTFAAYKMY